MFIIPNPFKNPKEFAMLALALTGLVIVVGGILGISKLLFPPLATSIERQGTGIKAIDARLMSAGQKLGSLMPA